MSESDVNYRDHDSIVLGVCHDLHSYPQVRQSLLRQEVHQVKPVMRVLPHPYVVIQGLHSLPSPELLPLFLSTGQPECDLDAVLALFGEFLFEGHADGHDHLTVVRVHLELVIGDTGPSFHLDSLSGEGLHLFLLVVVFPV